MPSAQGMKDGDVSLCMGYLDGGLRTTLNFQMKQRLLRLDTVSTNEVRNWLTRGRETFPPVMEC